MHTLDALWAIWTRQRCVTYYHAVPKVSAQRMKVKDAQWSLAQAQERARALVKLHMSPNIGLK